MHARQRRGMHCFWMAVVLALAGADGGAHDSGDRRHGNTAVKESHPSPMRQRYHMKYFDEEDGETWKDLYEDFQLANNTKLLSDEHSIVSANCTSVEELVLEVTERNSVMDWQEGALIVGKDQSWCSEAANGSKPFFRHVEGSPRLLKRSPDDNYVISIPTSAAEFNEAFEYAHVKYSTRAQRSPKEDFLVDQQQNSTPGTRRRDLKDSSLWELKFNYDKDNEKADNERMGFEFSDIFEACCVDCYAYMHAGFDPEFTVDFDREGSSDPRDWNLDITSIKAIFDTSLDIHAKLEFTVLEGGGIDEKTADFGELFSVDVGPFALLGPVADKLPVPSATVKGRLKAKLNVDADQGGHIAIGLGYHKDTVELGWEYDGSFHPVHRKTGGTDSFTDPVLEVDLPSRVKVTAELWLELELHIDGEPLSLSYAPTLTPRLVYVLEVDYSQDNDCPPHEPMYYFSTFKFQLSADFPDVTLGDYNLELCSDDLRSWAEDAIEQSLKNHDEWAKGLKDTAEEAVSTVTSWNPFGFLGGFGGFGFFGRRLQGFLPEIDLSQVDLSVVPFINDDGCIEVTFPGITLPGFEVGQEDPLEMLELSPWSGCAYLPVPNPKTPDQDPDKDSFAINYAGEDQDGNGQARLVIPIPLDIGGLSAYCSNCYVVLPANFDFELKISIGNPFAAFLPFVGEQQGTRRGAQLQKLKAVLSGDVEVNMEFTVEARGQVETFKEWMISQFFSPNGYKRLATIPIPIGPIPVPLCGVLFALPIRLEAGIQGKGAMVTGFNYVYNDIQLGFDYDTSRSGTREQLFESYMPDPEGGTFSTIGPDVSIAAGATASLNVGPSLTLAFLELIPLRIDFPVIGLQFDLSNIDAPGPDPGDECSGDQAYFTIKPFVELRLAFVNPLLLYADVEKLVDNLGAGEEAQERAGVAQQAFDAQRSYWEDFALGIPLKVAKIFFIPSFVYKPVDLASLRAYIPGFYLYKDCLNIPSYGEILSALEGQLTYNFPPGLDPGARPIAPPWPAAPPASTKLSPASDCTDATAPDDDLQDSIPCVGPDPCSEEYPNVLTIYVHVLRGSNEPAPGKEVTLNVGSLTGTYMSLDGFTSSFGCIFFKVNTAPGESPGGCPRFSITVPGLSGSKDLGCRVAGDLTTVIELDREALEERLQGVPPISVKCSECWCVKPVHDILPDAVTGGLAFHASSRTLLYTGCMDTDCSSGSSTHFLSQLNPYTNQANQVITVGSVEPASMERYSRDSVAAAGQHDVVVLRLASGEKVKMVDIATNTEVKTHTADEDSIFISASVTPTGVYLIEKDLMSDDRRVLETSVSEDAISQIDTLYTDIDCLEWDEFREQLYVYETTASEIRTYTPGSGSLGDTVASGFSVASMSLSADGEVLFFAGKEQDESLSSYRIYAANLTSYDIDVIAGDNPSAAPSQTGSPASQATISAPFGMASSSDPTLLFYIDSDQSSIMALRNTCALEYTQTNTYDTTGKCNTVDHSGGDDAGLSTITIYVDDQDGVPVQGVQVLLEDSGDDPEDRVAYTSPDGCVRFLESTEPGSRFCDRDTVKLPDHPENVPASLAYNILGCNTGWNYRLNEKFILVNTGKCNTVNHSGGDNAGLVNITATVKTEAGYLIDGAKVVLEDTTGGTTDNRVAYTSSDGCVRFLESTGSPPCNRQTIKLPDHPSIEPRYLGCNNNARVKEEFIIPDIGKCNIVDNSGGDNTGISNITVTVKTEARVPIVGEAVKLVDRGDDPDDRVAYTSSDGCVRFLESTASGSGFCDRDTVKLPDRPDIDPQSLGYDDALDGCDTSSLWRLRQFILPDTESRRSLKALHAKQTRDLREQEGPPPPPPTSPPPSPNSTLLQESLSPDCNFVSTTLTMNLGPDDILEPTSLNVQLEDAAGHPVRDELVRFYVGEQEVSAKTSPDGCLEASIRTGAEACTRFFVDVPERPSQNATDVGCLVNTSASVKLKLDQVVFDPEYDCTIDRASKSTDNLKVDVFVKNAKGSPAAGEIVKLENDPSERGPPATRYTRTSPRGCIRFIRSLVDQHCLDQHVSLPYRPELEGVRIHCNEDFHMEHTFNLTAGTGLELPPPVSGDKCEECNACVKTMHDEVVSPLRADTDGSKDHAALFMEACKRIASVGECRNARDMHMDFQKTHVTRRAAAMCAALDVCSPDMDCKIRSATLNVNGVGMDFCTADGTILGDLVGTKQVSPTPGRCFSNNDCEGNLLCDDSEGSILLEPQCSKKGFDQFLVQGACKNRCDLPRTNELLERHKTTFPPCNTTSDCSMGHTCRDAPDTCKQLNCDESSGQIVESECTKTCVPDTISLAGAQFVGPALIAVNLTAPAAAFSGSCSELFDKATMDLLGSSTCSVSGQVLVIDLGGNAQAMPGDVLTLMQGQNVLTSRTANASFTGSSEPIGPCNICPVPNARIVGPTVINEPCQPGDNLDPVLLILEVGNSGRPPSSVSWELVQKPSNYSLGDQDSLDTVLRRASNRGKMSVEMTAAAQTKMTAGIYELRVSVTSFLGQTASTNHTLEKQQTGRERVPSFAITTPTRTRVTDSLVLDADVQPSSVCSGERAAYIWRCVQMQRLGQTFGCGLLEDSFYQPTVQLEISRDELIGSNVTVDDTLTFELEGSFESSPTKATGTVDVTLLSDQLQPSLDGPVGAVQPNQTLVFSAAHSNTPESQSSIVFSSRRYSFSCHPVEDSLGSCFTDTYEGTVLGDTWLLNSSYFAQPDTPYEISVTISKGDFEAGPTASTSNVVYRASSEVLTTSIQRYCVGGPCPTEHNPSDSLSLTTVLDDVPRGSDVANANYSWSFTDFQARKLGYQLDGSMTLGGTDSASISIKPDALPRSDSVSVQCEVKLPGGTRGTGIAKIPLRRAPVCGRKDGCLELDKQVQAFPGVSFVAVARGFSATDEEEVLNYEFGLVSEEGEMEVLRPRSSASSYTFTASSGPRNYTSYVCAIDTKLARACSTSWFALEPAVSTDVETILSGIDFSVLLGTGDEDAAYEGASKVAAVLKGSSSEEMSSNKVTEALAALKALLNTTTGEGNIPNTVISTFASASLLRSLVKGLQQDGLLSEVTERGLSLMTSSQSGLDTTTARRALANADKGLDQSSRRRKFLQSGSDELQNLRQATFIVESVGEGLQRQVSPGAKLTASSKQLSVAASRNTFSSMAGHTIQLSTPEGASAQATATFPTSAMVEACEADEGCDLQGLVTSALSFYADSSAFSAATQWPNASAFYTDIIANQTVPTAVSGILDLSFSQRSSGDPLCPGSNCTLTLQLPLPEGWQDASNKATMCAWLASVDTNSSFFEAVLTGEAVHVDGQNNTATCHTTRLGRHTAVQYDTVPLNDGAGLPPSPPPSAPVDSPPPSPDSSDSPPPYPSDTSNYGPPPPDSDDTAASPPPPDSSSGSPPPPPPDISDISPSAPPDSSNFSPPSPDSYSPPPPESSDESPPTPVNETPSDNEPSSSPASERSGNNMIEIVVEVEEGTSAASHSGLDTLDTKSDLRRTLAVNLADMHPELMRLEDGSACVQCVDVTDESEEDQVLTMAVILPDGIDGSTVDSFADDIRSASAATLFQGSGQADQVAIVEVMADAGSTAQRLVSGLAAALVAPSLAMYLFM